MQYYLHDLTSQNADHLQMTQNKHQAFYMFNHLNSFDCKSFYAYLLAHIVINLTSTAFFQSHLMFINSIHYILLLLCF